MQQIQRLTAEGKTVFVSKGVWKVRMSDHKTIEFNDFFRPDSDNGRPIVDGGFYATSDPAEIEYLKGLRELSSQVYEPVKAEPKVEVVEDPSIKPVMAKGK